MEWLMIAGIIIMALSVALWLCGQPATLPTPTPVGATTDDSDRAGVQHDRVIVRNRFGRCLCGIFCLFVTLAFCMGIGEILFGRLLNGTWLGMILNGPVFGTLVGFIVGMQIVNKVVSSVRVIAPPFQAIVAQNTLTGAYMAYGSASHWKYPLEQIMATSHYFLQDMTDEVDVVVPTKGSKVKLKVAFRWQPWLEKLVGFANRGETTIKEEFEDRIREFLSEAVSVLADDQVQIALEFINYRATNLFSRPRVPIPFRPFDTDPKAPIRRAMKKIIDAIGAEKPSGGLEGNLKTFLQSLEQRLGIQMLEVFVYEVNFSNAVQAARNARVQIGILTEAAIEFEFGHLAKRKAQLAWQALDQGKKDSIINRILIILKDGSVNIYEGMGSTAPILSIKKKDGK
jgi:hypothetical protein